MHHYPQTILVVYIYAIDVVKVKLHTKKQVNNNFQRFILTKILSYGYYFGV